MKYCRIVSLCVIALFFVACGNESKEPSNQIAKNPVDIYLDSRTDAMSLAKKSVKESNERTQEQDKAIEALK